MNLLLQSGPSDRLQNAYIAISKVIPNFGALQSMLRVPPALIFQSKYSHTYLYME
jgi:hypothetical protein